MNTECPPPPPPPPPLLSVPRECTPTSFVDKLLVQADPGLYHHINQGVLDVDNMDDKEEMQLAEVCKPLFVCSETCLVCSDFQ